MTSCYAWPVTVGAGAALRLHVSTSRERFGVRLFRYGATVTEVASALGSKGIVAVMALPETLAATPFTVAPEAETP